MENLERIKVYSENGQNHESCNLSDMVFKDLDYSQFTQEISFFRSDFSRSRFYGCTFNRNSFGRADFIDVYMKSTEFDSVDFGSCLIKNALIEKTMFKSNHYRGIAIQYTSFKKCIFRDEDFITNMFHCSFFECTFINCTFKKSSLESNEFTRCEFIKVDMAECNAENLKFNGCSLRDVYLGANLWTTYLYRDTDIYSFGFKYRGNIVDIWNGSAELFVQNLLQREQYFEYLNTIIVGSMIPPHGLAKEIELLYPSILAQSSQLRKSTFCRILDMLLFYRNYHKIPLGEYIAIYSFFSRTQWGGLPFEEVLVYDAKLYKIQKTLEQLDFDLGYIKSLPSDAICISKFHINCDDSALAIEYLENAFNIANRDVCGDMYSKPLIRVIHQDKGSIILTIASSAMLVLLVSYVAKKAMHNVFSIQVESGIKKKIIKQLEESGTEITEIKKSCALAQKLSFLPNDTDNGQINHLASELTKGEILDVILSFLT